ncbi:MAG: hypothetical protein ACPLZD_05285 [Candidatus Saccharicenans sp.]|nr:MAG: hypothetical protein C0168_10635 [Candidatus Aminicenantes bacterium]HEK84859.1 hypothetical protein [Candidatus Aminicenantes bacterium]
MFIESQFQMNFFLVKKKLLRSKNALFISALPLVAVLYVLLADSLNTALKFFLFLFPYLFLFFSGDMMKDEIDSGILENVIFLEDRYRHYLFQKNFILFVLAFLFSASIFFSLTIASLLPGTFKWFYLFQFLAGTIIGAYYIALSGWLSFYFRGGANIIIVIVGQITAIVSLFFSMQERTGFLYYLEKGEFPNLIAKIKLSLLVLIIPNFLITKNLSSYLFLAILGAGLFLFLQWHTIKNLELKK